MPPRPRSPYTAATGGVEVGLEVHLTDELSDDSPLTANQTGTAGFR
jgi:hypothetical protein